MQMVKKLRWRSELAVRMGTWPGCSGGTRAETTWSQRGTVM